jgi:hypothetical protein
MQIDRIKLTPMAHGTWHMHPSEDLFVENGIPMVFVLPKSLTNCTPFLWQRSIFTARTQKHKESLKSGALAGQIQHAYASSKCRVNTAVNQTWAPQLVIF